MGTIIASDHVRESLKLLRNVTHELSFISISCLQTCASCEGNVVKSKGSFGKLVKDLAFV